MTRGTQWGAASRSAWAAWARMPTWPSAAIPRTSRTRPPGRSRPRPGRQERRTARHAPRTGRPRSACAAALSATYRPEDNTLSLSFDYDFLDAKDDPDLGTRIVRFGDPIDDMPASLQKGRDFLESEVHTFTFRGGYAFGDRFRVESATCSGFTDNGSVMTGARRFTPVGRPRRCC